MLCTAIRGRQVTLLLELAAFPGRSRSRRQFADASEERLGARNVAIGQVVPDVFEVYGGLETRHAAQRLDLRRKVPSAAVFTNKQRLLPAPAARPDPPPLTPPPRPRSG